MMAPSAAGPRFIVLNVRSGRHEQLTRLHAIDLAMQRAGRQHRPTKPPFDVDIEQPFCFIEHAAPTPANTGHAR